MIMLVVVATWNPRGLSKYYIAKDITLAQPEIYLQILLHLFMPIRSLPLPFHEISFALDSSIEELGVSLVKI